MIDAGYLYRAANGHLVVVESVKSWPPRSRTPYAVSTARPWRRATPRGAANAGTGW